MKYNINRNDRYSIATIIQKVSPIVTAYITVDLHAEQTTKDQTVQLMYGDALLSGAGKYDRSEFLGAVNLLGAGINISISDSYLNIKLTSTLSAFNKLLSLTEIMLTKPAFENKELVRIKKTTTNELHAAKEKSKGIASQGLRNTLYEKGDRRSSAQIDELIASVDTVTGKDLKKLHNKALGRSWTCSATGEASALSALEKMLTRIKTISEVSEEAIGIHKQNNPKKVAILKSIPSRQNIDLYIGAPLPITLHHPDYIPLSFAISVLGKWGGFTGRLMSTVRELEGLTYGIYARTDGFTGTEQGYWYITTFFAPDKTIQGLKSTYREILKLYRSGITKAELETFKTIALTQQTLLQDSPGSLLADLHAYHCQKFTLQEIKEHKARINTLTLNEVNEAIKTYLNPNTLTVSGAGPVNVVKNDVYKFIKSV